MTSILDYKINYFSDVASFVKGSIHVIDRDGSREVLCVSVFDVVNVDKPAHGP